MQLSKTTPCQKIDIWQPRWKDRKVLIACYKVGMHNEITFSRTNSMQGSYYISGENVKKCPVETNGTLNCYAVPMDDLVPLERV